MLKELSQETISTSWHFSNLLRALFHDTTDGGKKETFTSIAYKYHFINSNHFAYNINFLDRLRKKNISEAHTKTRTHIHVIHLNEKKVALIY